MSQDDVVEAESGGSGKVFLVLGLLAGVALGGGLGYYFFNTQPPTEGEQEAPKKKKLPAFEVGFERIAVPIYASSDRGRRFIGNYFVDLSLQVRGEENQIAVRRVEAQVQHAIISVISTSNLMREDSPFELDSDKAAKAVRDKVNQVLGKDIIENVSILNAIRM